MASPAAPPKKRRKENPKEGGEDEAPFKASEPERGLVARGTLAGGVKLLICLAKLPRSPPQIVESILVRRAS